jgi:C4-dicarboxylate-specific signal transduction histidine kinase
MHSSMKWVRAAARMLSMVAGLLIAAAPAYAAGEEARVLILNALDPYLPAYLAIDAAMRASLAKETARRIVLYSELLDEQRFPGASLEPEILALLTKKYRTVHIDVVVTVTKPAFEFFKRYGEQLWPGARLVFHGLPDGTDPSTLPPNAIGQVNRDDFAGTIDLARRLQPNARRILVISGTAPLDMELEQRARQVVPTMAGGAAVEFLSGWPLAELVNRVAGESADTIVLYLTQFRDRDGRPYLPREVLHAISSVSAAPVYGLFETYVGFGIAAGNMEFYEDRGGLVGQLVRDAVAGRSPEPGKAVFTVPSRCVADARELQRLSLDERRLPDGCDIRSAERPLWRQYWREIAVGIAILVFQATLIAMLLIERRSRRRTATALEESQKQMNLAVGAARLSMWIWDVSRDKIWVTTQLGQRAGRSNEQPTSFDDILEAANPADREALDRAVRKALASGDELDIEYRMAGPDGEQRWIAARGRAEKGNGQRLLGVALDITERKVAEIQAEKDRGALQHMTRVSMLGQLSASIAHQLNQPLAAILGNAEAARKMLTREGVDLEELREICDDIVAEDNRAAEVIRRLGALYKRGEMKMEPLDLNELTRETLELLRTELLTRHVMPRTDLAPSLPMIDGDRVQLQQVLLNLILNAADAMSELELDNRSLTIRSESSGADVRLYVVDNGPGIAGSDLKHIFEAFWSTKPGGMGIGLAICQSIVEAQHGRIAAANNATGGTTFCVSLPVRHPT